METKISCVDGCEGNSFYLGDVRIAGPKPWGGGRVISEKKSALKDILYAMNNLYDTAHQPLRSELAEAERLIKNIRGNIIGNI